jgi:DNA-binding SARP family transcriptional activator/tetratricopeptide (TPR) repeat protein
VSELQTLGRVSLTSETESGPRVVAVQPKRLALLTYLAVAEPRGVHRRDTVVAFFWPELGQDEARRALRQALHYLRGVVGDDAFEGRSDEIGLRDGSLACDAVEFDRLLATDRAEDALTAYRGDFLAGFHVPDVAPEYEEWVDRTRSRLRDLATRAAWRTADVAERDGRASAAVGAALRALELAPEDERGLTRVLEMLERHGDRARALQVYGTFAKRLRTEYDVEPAPDTMALAERIRTAPPRVVAPAPAISAPAPATPVAPVVKFRGRRWRVPALTLVVVAAIGAAYAAQHARSSGKRARASRDRILVASVANHTTDSTLGLVLGEALEVDLQQSPLVQVLSPAQVRRVLALMQRPQDVLVDEALAREIAQREGLKLFVTGDVSTIGRSYVLSARIVAVPSGDVLGAARASAADSTEIIPAIGRLSRELRGQLGESLRSVNSSPALSRVTTTSLGALRLYARAIDASARHGDVTTGIRLSSDAVTLDTGFAMAFAMLGSLYYDELDWGRSVSALRHAYEHRDRLTFHERQLVLGAYYLYATNEYDKAIGAYRELLDLYPEDYRALNSVANAYYDQRQFEQADTFYLRAIRADPLGAGAQLNHVNTLIDLGRFDAARVVFDSVTQRFPGDHQNEQTEVFFAMARQDWDAAARHAQTYLAVARGDPLDEMDAYETSATVALAVGRLAQAERDSRSAMQLAEQNTSPFRYLSSAMRLGWLELRYRHRPDRARAEVDAALSLHPLAALAPSDRPYLELVHFFAAAGDMPRAQAMLARFESDSAMRIRLGGAAWQDAQGALALAQHRTRDAIDQLRLADVGNRCPICVLPDLARAYDDAGDAESAIAAYERYLRTPWIWRLDTDQFSLGWSMQRAAQLYELRGEPARAAQQYNQLLRLWSGADPELAPVIAEARARLVALGTAAR